jgi:CheY-like chemotaxis protein
MHAQARDVVRMLASDAAVKQITLRSEMTARAHHVHADATRIQQVLWNLLRNALKFTPRGGSVTLSTSNPAPDRLLLSVTDTGAGIERDVLDRLFTPFEQGGEQVTRHFGGLGLGLAISKGIIDLHHGTISVASEGPGRGATFTVELPAVSPPADAGRKQSPPRPRVAGAAPCRLLLVEDHPDTSRIMAKLLTLNGYSVVTANDIRTALEIASGEHFDFLISDIGLPDGSGLDLMRRLRQRQPLRGIALSGYGMEEDVRKSMDAGFMAHLTKPVNVQKLQEVLAQLAPEPQQRASNIDSSSC